MDSLPFLRPKVSSGNSNTVEPAMQNESLIRMPPNWIDKPLSDEYIKQYVSFFGYAKDEHNNPLPAESLTKEQTLAAVLRFQEQNGLVQDGKVGKRTAGVMLAPRCGVKEYLLSAAATSLWKWNGRIQSNGITLVEYYVDPILCDQLKMTREVFDSIVKTAFEFSWSQHSNIDYKRRSTPGSEYCLNVRGATIDGPSSILADCELPVDGRTACDMRIDISDNYIAALSAGSRGILFGNVLEHEKGHGDGMPHSRRPNALMAPIYSAAIPHPVQDDDIPRYQARYDGIRKVPLPGDSPTTTTTTTTTTGTTSTTKPPVATTTTPKPPQPTFCKVEEIMVKINGQEHRWQVP